MLLAWEKVYGKGPDHSKPFAAVVLGRQWDSEAAIGALVVLYPYLRSLEIGENKQVDASGTSELATGGGVVSRRV